MALSATLEQPRPDPFLGEFTPENPTAPRADESPADPGEAPPSWDLASLVIEPPPPDERERSFGSVTSFDFPAAVPPSAPSGGPAAPQVPGAPDALSSLSIITTPPPVDGSQSSASIGAVDLSAPPASPAVRRVMVEEEGDDYEDEPRRTSWAFVLLTSYASAVTIGLIYVLWLLRGQRALTRPVEEPDVPPPADTRVDPGQRARNSHKIEPPPPIPAANLTTLGKTITLGSLEVTPVAVTCGPVLLRHTLDPSEVQRGGAGALRLRFKLRNISRDAVFAPLDEAFVREREAGVSDSYIDKGGGETIEMYHLAVASELAIVGQVFRELEPGEVLDTVVVSAPDTLARVAPEMTWRIRLRTGIDRTDFLGVRFKASDIKARR